MAGTITVDRHVDGTAKFTYTDGATSFSANGYWDDATPWVAGSYDLDFWRYKGDSASQAFGVKLPSSVGRSGILIHRGENLTSPPIGVMQGTKYSEGCLVAPQSFLNKIYETLSALPSTFVNGRDGGLSPVKLVVTGDFDVKLALSATTPTVKEGDDIELKIALTGAGIADGGISKGVYVRLGVTGGTATAGADFDAIGLATNAVTHNGTHDWFYIPPNQTLITVRLKTVSADGDAPKQGEAAKESINFKILGYEVENKYNSFANYYTDEATTLTKGATTSATVNITDKPTILDKAINESGNAAGYDNVKDPIQFAPGQAITGSFDPQTIPDRMVVSVFGTGQVLVDTTFIGGKIVPISFKVPETSDGRIRIQILTNNSGTAWSFFLTSKSSGNAPGEMSTIVISSAAHDEETPVSAAAGVSLLAYHRNLTEGGSSDGGLDFDFSITVDRALYANKILRWEVVSTGGQPVSAADFATGALPSGLITVPSGVNSDGTSYISISTAVRDLLAEGVETFAVRLVDTSNGAVLADLGLTDPTQAFAIWDLNAQTPAAASDGSGAADTILGTPAGDAISTGLGDDIVYGRAGGDQIDGGAGSDQLSGGSGDDVITPGFGTDSVDGGDGNDTIVLPRALSDLQITRQSDGSVRIVDISSVPLGTKTVGNVEVLAYNGGQIVLNSAVLALTGGVSADTLTAQRFGVLIDGLGGDDRLTGGNGDDVLKGGAGNDVLVGGAGDDTALYAGASGDFSWWQNSDGSVTVKDLRSARPEGADTLTSMEYLKFSNGTVKVGDLSTAEKLAAAYRNILFVEPVGSSALVLANTIVDKVTAGQQTYAQGVTDIVHAAANTTSVAILTYQFFTGKIPWKGGFTYLLDPGGPNPNSLGSAYYQTFNIDNRYINFAVNLGSVGEGASKFTAVYGGLSLSDSFTKAYTTIFGSAPGAQQLALLSGLVPDGHGGMFTRADYFAYYGKDGSSGIGAKAAMVGWLLSEAIKADVGVYAKSNDALLTDLADGAGLEVDLIGVYGKPEYVYHSG